MPLLVSAKPEGMGMHGQLIEPWHRRCHAPQHLPDTHIGHVLAAFVDEYKAPFPIARCATLRPRAGNRRVRAHDDVVFDPSAPRNG
jgi:hypothetical protein